MHESTSGIDAAWNFADPAGSEARFAAMLSEAAQMGAVSRSMEIRTQLARAQGLQRKFAEAHATLDEVQSWLAGQEAATVGAAARIALRLRLERGRVLNSAGDAAGALPHFVEALEAAERARAAGKCGLDGLAVDAAHMAAIADPADADEWNRKALHLAESSPDPDARRWRASLLNNIGWTRFETKDYSAALVLFERALAARVEQGTTGKLRGPWLIARWCVAKTKRALGRVEDALAEQQQLAAEHAAAGTTDGFVQEELGECLLALGRGAEAAPHFARAHALLSGDVWLAEREPDRLARLKRLATPQASG